MGFDEISFSFWIHSTNKYLRLMFWNDESGMSDANFLTFISSCVLNNAVGLVSLYEIRDFNRLSASDLFCSITFFHRQGHTFHATLLRLFLTLGLRISTQN